MPSRSPPLFQGRRASPAFFPRAAAAPRDADFQAGARRIESIPPRAPLCGIGQQETLSIWKTLQCFSQMQRQAAGGDLCRDRKRKLRRRSTGLSCMSDNGDRRERASHQPGQISGRRPAHTCRPVAPAPVSTRQTESHRRRLVRHAPAAFRRKVFPPSSAAANNS